MNAVLDLPSHVVEVLNEPNITTYQLQETTVFPNSRLVVVLYRKAVNVDRRDPAWTFEQLFGANKWHNCWRNGIYPFHHYHSTAHEVLGICAGSASVQLGGEWGQTEELEAGDVLIIPAGVAHKNLGSTMDFSVVGAYPHWQDWDMNYGRSGERPAADRNITRVGLPELDPVYGSAGPLIKLWHIKG